MAVNTTTLAGILAASRANQRPAVNTNTLEGVLRASNNKPTPTRTATPKPTAKPTARPTATRTATTTPVRATAPAQITPPAPGWSYDDDRGGFTPPPEAEGTGVIAGQPAQMPEPVQAAAPAYSVYEDPFYQQALQGAQSQFNLERTNALGTKAYEERAIQRELQGRPATAEAERRRLAGNFAARGMGGGRAGALTRAEAEVNAREVTARTGLREQMAELNRQFVGQFGAEGTDWLGTLRGSQAQQAAIQAALQNRLAGLTTVG